MGKIIPFGGERSGGNYDRLAREVQALSLEAQEELLVPALKQIISSAINALPESESKKKHKLVEDFKLLIHVGGLIQFGKKNNLLPKDFNEQHLLVEEYAKSKNIKISE
jgi:hypothetical protein